MRIQLFGISEQLKEATVSILETVQEERNMQVKRTKMKHNDNNITVIDGGGPMMFLDFGHKCMRWMLGILRRLPS
ncbi:MAG: hypothetical protein GY805_39930 [Chloroflexi bacterium]|nr:hypothetical protein [Chloroflexota bacterium]